MRDRTARLPAQTVIQDACGDAHDDLGSIAAPELFSYAIMRSDLDMAPGKLASQAAHACAQSLLEYLAVYPAEIPRLLAAGNTGTRVILSARGEWPLLQTFQLAKRAGLPCALFYDSGHVLPPHFTGEPILTGLAIGPAPKELMRHLTKKFRCI